MRLPGASLPTSLFLAFVLPKSAVSVLPFTTSSPRITFYRPSHSNTLDDSTTCPSSTTRSITTMRGGATSKGPDPLRTLFPNTSSVMIYPDDFNTEPTTPGGTIDIIFPDLVDRLQGHFSDRRVAVMFRPGTYNDVNFPIGYWTQALGLGETPDLVKFTGRFGPHAIPANTDNTNVGSLDTFWRSAENFYSDTTFVKNSDGSWSIPVGTLTPQGTFPNLYAVNPTNDRNNDQSRGMLWACSQAAPLRRIKVANNLHLSLGANFASGGFVGNIDIGGYLLLGSQQQFCIRNCNIQTVNPGAWSTVLIGNKYPSGRPVYSPPPDDTKTVTNEPQTRVQVEKPFIFLDDANQVNLAIPKVKFDAVGIQHSKLDDDEKVLIDNDKNAKVFSPQDSFQSVEEAARKGLHIILSPGTYTWGKTLKIATHNQVVLGLGMATIQAPADGTPCLHVASGVSGVRISGLSLEASVVPDNKYAGSTLLQWGDKGIKSDPGNSNNPGAIHDLYCFVGGRSLNRDVQVECMVRLYSGNIVGDNLWLWRADHVALAPGEQPNKDEYSEYHVTTFGECKCDMALEVYGDNVLLHGLAAEHTYSDNVVWRGVNGTVIFYQNELPYDVPGYAFVDKSGYLVHETATGHTAKGVGVYSFFRDYSDVTVSAAVRYLPKLPSVFENVFAVWLNGTAGIKSVINGLGGPTSTPSTPFIVRDPAV